MSNAPFDVETLFRKEALAQATSMVGSPIKLLGVSGWLITIFFLLIFFTTIFFLGITKYSRKETVVGYVTTTDGSYKVTAPHSGVVNDIYVHEGDQVKAGQKLFITSSNTGLEGGANLAEELKLSLAIQGRAQQQQLAGKLEQNRSQIDEIELKRIQLLDEHESWKRSKKILQRRLKLQEDTVAGDKKLAEEGMTPLVLLRQHEDVLLSVQEQYQQADRELERGKSLLSQLTSQLARLKAEAQTAKSEADSVRAQLRERSISTESAYTGHLTSPIDGVIASMQVKSGSSVSANQQLAMIVPTGAIGNGPGLEVELWAPSRAIGFVKQGAEVRIMYDAFLYQTFGVGKGYVKEISKMPVTSIDLPFPMDTKEQLFKIRVSIEKGGLDAYGQHWPLSPGMRLTADVVLEEQSLINWLLEPLRAFGNRS